MADLAVNLYEYDFNNMGVELKNSKIKIKRVLSPNSDNVIDFVNNKFNQGWASEIKAALYNANPSCFIAVLDEKIIGFACYDATAKGYFGPTGIDSDYRGLNVGQLLLFKTLNSMKEDGYGYGIIGGVSTQVVGFYGRYLNVTILNSQPDVYKRLIKR